MDERILVVDDEPIVCKVLTTLLNRQGYQIFAVGNGADALRLLEERPVDLLITDICMPEMSGIALMQQARRQQPDLPVILVTGYASVATATEALKAGAFDYIRKPFKYDELVLTVERALAYERAVHEAEALPEALRKRYHFSMLVGDSAAMRNVYQAIDRAAVSGRPALIVGESGTGKRLVARAIHSVSAGRDDPFVAFNCASLPPPYLPPQLFGDAVPEPEAPGGAFGAAAGGTLFLDEIGQLAPPLQQRLAKSLADDGAPRLVAATTAPLGRQIEGNTFHPELGDQLYANRIQLPPLRDRLTDIPLLVQHFVCRYNIENERSVAIENTVLLAMQEYTWPGNVRELENAILRGAAATRSDRITVDDLPETVANCVREASLALPSVPSAYCGRSLRNFLKEKEQEYINHVLQLADGNRPRAAEMLGISVATLYRKFDRKTTHAGN